MHQLILFDLDGTIIDSIPLIIESYLRTFNQFHLTPPSVKHIMSGIGVPLDDYVRQTVPPMLVSEFIQAFKSFNMSHITTHIGLFIKAWHLIKGLYDRGIPLGVMTSKRLDAAYLSLDQFELTPMMRIIQGAEQTTAHKPSPLPLLNAIQMYNKLEHKNLEPKAVLYIGDNVMDIQCANRAGCPAGIVTWTQMDHTVLRAAGPFKWIDHIQDVLNEH